MRNSRQELRYLYKYCIQAINQHIILLRASFINLVDAQSAVLLV